jgi:hypothetical protein
MLLTHFHVFALAFFFFLDGTAADVVGTLVKTLDLFRQLS